MNYSSLFTRDKTWSIFSLFALLISGACSMGRESLDTIGSLDKCVSHQVQTKVGKICKFRIPRERLKLSFGLTTGLERVLKLLLTDCFTKRGKLWFSIFYLCVFSFLGRNSINKLQLLPTFGLRNRLRFGLLLPWRGSGLRAWPRVPRLHELEQRVSLLRDPGPPPLHDRECPQENGNVLL